jgi:hypothetical protein
MNYLEKEAIQVLEGVKLSNIFRTFFLLHSGNLIWKTKGEGKEFFEHREYHIGDDIKNINWKVFARTGKLFTKIFSSEISKDAIVLLDTSNSMLAGKEETKLEYSKFLVSVLAYKLISEGYNVLFSSFNDNLARMYEISDKNFLRFQNLLTTTKCSGITNFKNVWLELAHSVRKRVNIVIVSDFLFLERDDIINLRWLFPNNSIVLFEVLSGEEIKFFDGGFLELVNPEDDESKVLSSNSSVKQRYLERMANFIEMITHNCLKNQISFSTFSISEPYYITLKKLYLDILFKV